MKRSVYWMIWLAYVAGTVAFPFVLTPARVGQGQDRTLLAVGLLVMGLLPTLGIRWALLPRLQNPMHRFKAYVFGLALAEGLVFYGIFLVPDYQWWFFSMGLLGILQYYPKSL